MERQALVLGSNGGGYSIEASPDGLEADTMAAQCLAVLSLIARDLQHNYVPSTSTGGVSLVLWCLVMRVVGVERWRSEAG